MKFTKEQLIEIKYLLKLFYERYPRKRMTSLVTVGTLNISCLSFLIYSLFFEDYEIMAVVKGLIASGVSMSLLITMIVLYICDYVDEEDKDSVKKKVRK